MEKVDDIIKEIAIKHGIAVDRDDPIMILYTINERLLKENAVAQRQILNEFREELESAAHEWEITTKKTAERILDVALTASKEAIVEGGKNAANAIGREVDSRLIQTNSIFKKACIWTITGAIIALLCAVTTLWAIR